MRNFAQIGLTLALLTTLACKSTAEGDGKGAPQAGASATAQAQVAEAHVSRDAATKLIDLGTSPSPSEPGPGERNGEIAIAERNPQGATTAMRLFSVRPDSLLGRAGFQNGDRVLDVNGVAPGDPKERWDGIRGSNRLEVHMNRRGAATTLRLIVE